MNISPLKNGLRIAVTVILVLFIVRYIHGDWDQFCEAIRNASPAKLLISQLCFIGGNLTIAFSWRFLLKILGADIGNLGALKAFYFSILGKYIPGKIWVASARVIVSQKHGAGEGTASLGMLLESVFLIVTAAFAGGLAITQWHGDLPSQIRWALFLSPLSLIILHPVVLRKTILYLNRRFPKRVSVPDKMPSFSALLSLAWIYMSIWVWWGAGFYFALSAIIQLPVDYFVPLLGGNTLAWLTGFVAFVTPAGLGVRELVLMSMLTGITGMGAAGLAAVLSRFFQLTGEVLGALVMWLIEKRTKRLDSRPM